jgi:hypothetical protein
LLCSSSYYPGALRSNRTAARSLRISQQVQAHCRIDPNKIACRRTRFARRPASRFSGEFRTNRRAVSETWSRGPIFRKWYFESHHPEQPQKILDELDDAKTYSVFRAGQQGITNSNSPMCEESIRKFETGASRTFNELASYCQKLKCGLDGIGCASGQIAQKTHQPSPRSSSLLLGPLSSNDDRSTMNYMICKADIHGSQDNMEPDPLHHNPGRMRSLSPVCNRDRQHINLCFRVAF